MRNGVPVESAEDHPPKINGGHWTEKALHRFAGPAPGAQYGDGALPNGGLVLDDTGVVYGTTFQGGNNTQGRCEGWSGGNGLRHRIALVPPGKKGGQWSEKLLHVFMNGNDGAEPGAGVILDANGSLYGGAGGGVKGGGIIFRLWPTGNQRWAGAVLYKFALAPDGGVGPAVVGFDRRGNLYGITYQGPGESLHGGSVFRLRPPGGQQGAWTLGILHGFTSEPDGTVPNPLTADRFGNIYGTTQSGGASQSCQAGCGTVFKLTP